MFLVHQLVIPGDGANVHVYCSNRAVPELTSRKDLPHSPLDVSVMERVPLEEPLSGLINLHGIDVHRVHGDHPQRQVRDLGGLAAFPRH